MLILTTVRIDNVKRCLSFFISTDIAELQRKRERETETERKTERQRETETDRERYSDNRQTRREQD